MHIYYDGNVNFHYWGYIYIYIFLFFLGWDSVDGMVTHYRLDSLGSEFRWGGGGGGFSDPNHPPKRGCFKKIRT